MQAIPPPAILTPEQQATDDALSTEQNFEWKDDVIKLVCTSDVPNHPAYGMGFEEYKRERNSYRTSDDDETVRIGFRMTDFLTLVSSDIASREKLSHYRFIVLILELGLIHFQHQYHEDYATVKEIRGMMLNKLVDESALNTYLLLQKQSIALNGSRTAKILTPTLPKWLGNTIQDTATYLRMSTSDFAMLCWCIGVSKTISDIPPVIASEIDGNLKKFDFEFDFYMSQVRKISDSF